VNARRNNASSRLIVALAAFSALRLAIYADHTVLVAAAIFATRALTDWDGKRSSKLVSTVYDEVEKPKLRVATLEAKG